MNGLTAKGIVVFSGGSAANNLVDVFSTVSEHSKSALSYVIPVSDNGGSSSELIRVFGGPGIGDVRSRLVRLIPDDPEHANSSKAAIRTFFNYRLSKDPVIARKEWLDIVEARHVLWDHIDSAKKELIRSFLNLLNLEIVKRVRPSSTFDFSSASVGNLFLTGARLFSGSFESAIYLLSSICSVPDHIAVLPAVNTNFSLHISAGLADGTTIVGQNAISHPGEPTALNVDTGLEIEYHDCIEDANLPGSLPTLRKQYIAFSKADEEDLPARIERIWYINPYGQKIRPPANPKVVAAVTAARTIVYSIGSLYTSLVPSLVLKGVGRAIVTGIAQYKILILNSTIDRESGPPVEPFTATDFIAAIARAGCESQGQFGSAPRESYRDFVTHLVHLQGPGTPRVNKEELAGLGIEMIRLYGRRVEGENFLRYDEKALAQALEAIIGRRDPRTEKSRRNTMES